MKRPMPNQDELPLSTSKSHKCSMATPVASVPASTSPDPSSDERAPQSKPFPYRDYLAARNALQKALGGSPFYAVLVGASGMGKTSLMRDLSSSLDRQKVHVLYLSSVNATLLGISRFFAQTCHLTPKRFPLETIKVLADALRSQPTHKVIWIDEADRLPRETLADVRILAECDHEIPQLFSIIFAGLPDLNATLNSTPLFSLKRRITLRLSLSGLCRDEVDPFLVHRFGSRDEKRIPIHLRDELFERAQANPALLDCIMRHALSRAGNGILSEEHLQEGFDAADL